MTYPVQTSQVGSHPEFSDSQVWCRTSGKRLKFLDQSLEIARYYEDDSESEEQDARHGAGLSHLTTESASGPSATSKLTTTTGPKTDIWAADRLPMRRSADEDAIFNSRAADTPRLALNAAPQRSDHLAPVSTPPSELHHHSRPQADRRHYSFESRSTLSPYSVLQYGASPPLHVAGAPLNERGKAELFRYYVKNIGPAFDAYDPNKYFTERIPSQATLSSPLLELILAVSAWHYHATKGDQGSAKLDVNLEQLVLTGLEGDSLDVALLLHQFLLNMDGPKSDYSVATFNAPGVRSAMSPPSFSRPLDTFHDDIMWARLRQEVFLAVLNQKPLTVNVDRSRLEQLARTRDDRARANRMLVELMDTVQYCFGDDRNTSAYDALLEASSAWMLTNPSSFTPVMIRRRQHPGEIFPEIWLLNDCVAAGLQYFHLARILLVVHDPRVPQLCRARKRASNWIEAQTKNDLEIICGIADSLSDINPLHITACMAISMVGDRFTHQDQQHALFDMLVKTANKYGLSTESVQKHLLEAWGWSSK